MNKDKILKRAVIPGVIALAAALLFFRLPITADSVAGYSSVIIMTGILVVEYRVRLKEFVGR
jgi:hypothetical protein